MGNNKNTSTPKVFMVPAILMIFMWVILFLPAGTIKLWEAWTIKL